jgi:hypothetical protein
LPLRTVFANVLVRIFHLKKKKRNFLIPWLFCGFRCSSSHLEVYTVWNQHNPHRAGALQNALQNHKHQRAIQKMQGASIVAGRGI